MFMYVLVFLLQYGKYYYGSVVTHGENISSCKKIWPSNSPLKSQNITNVFILYIFIPTLLGNVLKKNIFWKITNI